MPAGSQAGVVGRVRRRSAARACSSICHARAPPARSTSAIGGGVDRRRRAPHEPARPGRGTAGSPPARCASPRARPAPARAACSRVAAAGSRSAQRFAGGGPSPGRLCGGQLGLGDGAARGQRAEPGARPACGWPGRGRPAARAAPPSFVGSACDGGDHRGVRQHPAGGDVAAAGQLVAGLPQRAEHAELPAAAQAVHAGGAPPRVDPAAPAGRRRGSPRTPAGPTRSCPAPRRIAASASRRSTSTSTSRAA